ncbi:MAG: Gfo/Idh/MocA family oxidoreductase [Planctomycetes bacterium]|nr:Gfo/Idh/MocA family oxidoreductase [Planctomycetota bacterium]
MSAKGGLHVALVGLNFGAEFVPIYLHHPDVEALTICDRDPSRLTWVGDRYNVQNRSADLDELLADDEIDALHLVTPPTVHAAQSAAVLRSGKHCACTIPMGLTLDELRDVIAAQRESGKNFMMMETSVYTREFLFAKDMMERGELGTITFVRGAHLQDMVGWPDYWLGFPPLVHITHAFAPALALLKTRAVKVHCFGSGELRDDVRGNYGNPFPFETAIFRLEGTNVAAEVSRFMYQTARAYTESFAIYGDEKSFEWQQLEHEDPIVFTRGDIAERVKPPDRAELLPAEIARFTQRGVYDESQPALSFLQGGGHGGSHPHLVHEFVRSIVEGRKSWINEITAANWTASGICAHESAMQDGAEVIVPSFE